MPGIRFHNLSLDKSETWILETPNAIGLRRGEDALMVINKAAEPFRLRNYASGVQSGEYREIATGWRLDVQPDGTIREWVVPGRMAVMCPARVRCACVGVFTTEVLNFT